MPLPPGLFTFTVRATDAGACVGAREYTTAVAAIPALDPLALALMAIMLGLAGLFAVRLMT